MANEGSLDDEPRNCCAAGKLGIPAMGAMALVVEPDLGILAAAQGVDAMASPA